MALEEKTSFWIEDGIHLKTEITTKRGKKKNCCEPPQSKLWGIYVLN